MSSYGLGRSAARIRQLVRIWRRDAERWSDCNDSTEKLKSDLSDQILFLMLHVNSLSHAEIKKIKIKSC